MTSSEKGETQRLRAARNQSLIREVNNRIYGLAGFEQTTEYVCECGLRACAAHVVLSPEEYLALRDEPTQFVVVPGHWSPNAERLVREGAGYEVIEKTGESRVLAERSARSRGLRGG